jgi:hypothetical protein
LSSLADAARPFEVLHFSRLISTDPAKDLNQFLATPRHLQMHCEILVSFLLSDNPVASFERFLAELEHVLRQCDKDACAAWLTAIASNARPTAIAVQPAFDFSLRNWISFHRDEISKTHSRSGTRR